MLEAYRVDFFALDWMSPVPGVRHKMQRRGGRCLRLVEYRSEMAPHWCARGHVGMILEGRMEIEFEAGTWIFDAGDGVDIPQGDAHRHRARALTDVVRVVFVEEDSSDRAYPSDVFDRLSRHYDERVEHRDDFPFVGYRDILLGVIQAAAPVADMRILELGVGTGNLALLFEEVGCEIWAVDYSRLMIEQASRKLRRTHLIEADLLGDWWGEVPAPFDRIVASYALHHFDLPTKCRLLRRMADELLVKGGWIVLADISFPTRSALQAVREELGDNWEDEDYWVADEAVEALAGEGLSVDYRQVSSCGGIYTVR